MPWYEHCIALSEREGEIEMVSLRKQLYPNAVCPLVVFFPQQIRLGGYQTLLRATGK